jgi:4-diphosphocytidyl-2-C-methyl-D-erythritol kinase
MIWEGPGPAPPEIASLPPEQNLVHRAVSLFREKTGFSRGLRGRVIKRVPPGSGYGGGSSDAAAALLALNSLSGGALGPGALPAMAAALGSDVPFFLQGGAALVRGRGERVETLPVPRGLTAVLVKPPFSSGTGAAFARLDRRREEEGRRGEPAGGRGGFGTPERGAGNLPAPGLGEGLLRESLTGPPAAWPFYNDFLPLFLETPGEGGYYQEILRSLKGLGADFAGLSGSGSGCYGIITDEGRAERAETELGNSRTFVQMTARACIG